MCNVVSKIGMHFFYDTFESMLQRCPEGRDTSRGGSLYFSFFFSFLRKEKTMQNLPRLHVTHPDTMKQSKIVPSTKS